MNNNAWFKKEKPLLSLQSMGGGAAGALMKGASSKVYVDEVFSTYADSGTGSARTIVNNIDLADKGGLVWQKWRSGSATANENNTSHILADTVRGTSKYVKANTTDGEFSVSAVGAFNSNGYQTGGNLTSTDNSGDKYVGWTFAKQEGFLDIVEYTGTGSTQTLSHSLGSVPGCIMVKRTDTTADWGVYHRGQNGGEDPEDYRLRLNSTTTENNDTYWGDTAPTATQFTVGDAHTEVNASGGTYIAYIFAGGGDPNGQSIQCSGGNAANYLTVPSHSDLTLDGDFTIEFWFKKSNTTDHLFTIGDSATSTGLEVYFSSMTLMIYGGNLTGSTGWADIDEGWHHIAITRTIATPGVMRIFIDGIYRTGGEYGTHTVSGDIVTGEYYSGTQYGTAKDITNFRLTKGQILYYNNFRVPTKALTTTSQGAVSSNVKLLFLNGSTTTAATVTPTTITQTGTVSVATGSKNTPFDDPAAFIFGEEEENIIKTGHYNGDGTGFDKNEINCGWEPQWILIKNCNSSNYWMLMDCLRGVVYGTNSDQLLYPNGYDGEDTSDRLELTATGFKLGSANDVNQNNDNFVYIAIRRPDGYVGKPPETGWEVFNYSTNNNTDVGGFYIPSDYSTGDGFPVDFGWAKLYTGSTGDWWTSARLMQKREYRQNLTNQSQTGTNKIFDSNVSWHGSGVSDSYVSHMWKRHAGFDVVIFDGTSAHTFFNHNLNAVPEMMWVRTLSNSSSNTPMKVWSNAFTSTTYTDWNSNRNVMATEATTQANESSASFGYGYNAPYTSGDTLNTSREFFLGGDNDINRSGYKSIALLFASVTGISKCGTYQATGNTDMPITTGFEPRFILIKRASGGAGNWVIYDKRRGFDYQLVLNTTAVEQNMNPAVVGVNATGFTLPDSDTDYNNSGDHYIYYAHA